MNKRILALLTTVVSIGAVSIGTVSTQTMNTKNVVLQAHRVVAKNSIKVTSYSLTHKTVTGKFTIAKSLNLGNPNNGISIGTNLNSMNMPTGKFNTTITAQNGKSYNLMTYTGVLPAGTYTYHISDVPSNAYQVVFQLSSNNGNVTTYTHILPYQYIINLKTNSYNRKTKTVKASFDLVNPMNLNDMNNGISAGTNLNSLGLPTGKFDTTITARNGKRYNLMTYKGVLPKGRYTITIKDVPVKATKISVGVTRNMSTYFYNCNL